MCLREREFIEWCFVLNQLQIMQDYLCTLCLCERCIQIGRRKRRGKEARIVKEEGNERLKVKGGKKESGKKDIKVERK